MRQRGTFYSEKLTFGSDREFPNVRTLVLNFKIQKPRQTARPPSYGPFKNPDLPHQGYNKTIGRNFKYMEDPEVDSIMYQKGVKGPIWRGPTHAISTPIKTVHDYFRNSARENPFLLSQRSRF